MKTPGVKAGKKEPRPSKTHEVKCWPEFFRAVESGEKLFELRKNDRDYRVGDYIYQREWRPKSKRYTGRAHSSRIVYAVYGPTWGLKRGYCILGLEPPECNESHDGELI